MNATVVESVGEVRLQERGKASAAMKAKRERWLTERRSVVEKADDPIRFKWE
jgi:hypothetical protein